MMKTSNYIFSDNDRFYFVNTRGKLTKYEVTVFASNTLYDKMIVYLVKTTSLLAHILVPQIFLDQRESHLKTRA
jgi:hypothetical protein